MIQHSFSMHCPVNFIAKEERGEGGREGGREGEPRDSTLILDALSGKLYSKRSKANLVFSII